MTSQLTVNKIAGLTSGSGAHTVNIETGGSNRLTISNTGIVIPNAGNIGSASDTDAIAISSGGVCTFSQNTVGAGGTDLLYTLTSSSSVSSHDISSTYINSTYDNYHLVGYFEGDGDTKYLQARVMVGGVVQSSSIYSTEIQAIGTADDNDNNNSDDDLFTAQNVGMGGEDGEGVSVSIVFQNANHTQAPFCAHGMATYSNTSGQHEASIFSGSMLVANRANVVNGLSLKMHSGNITYAKFKLYGIRD